MNERAKQLALQALKHPDNDNDGLTVFDNDELKKFAELIVRECANIAADQSAIRPEYRIRKHFGVE
jgi:hypothetical protein